MFPSKQQARVMAKGLGWFSIALGVAELLAARPMARATGLPGRQTLVRSYGAREIATGVGLLNARDPEPWLWMRLAGDALDLATLLPPPGRAQRGNTVAVAAVLGVTALDLMAATALASQRQPARATTVDYSRRSGWPLPADEMRGAALADFKPPPDFRTPEALRPWTQGRRQSAAATEPELRSSVPA